MKHHRLQSRHSLNAVRFGSAIFTSINLQADKHVRGPRMP